MKPDDSLRRLPIYMLLDCSEAMAGEPIEAVRMGLRSLLSDLQTDPSALETVWLSVITFGSSAKQVVPLTGIGSFVEPELRTDTEAGRALGAGLRVLLDASAREVRKTTADVKGDCKPLVFIMTVGAPTDDWKSAADEIKQNRIVGNIIGCAAGPGADDTVLKRITETVVRLEDTCPGTLGDFLPWDDRSIGSSEEFMKLAEGGMLNLEEGGSEEGGFGAPSLEITCESGEQISVPLGAKPVYIGGGDDQIRIPGLQEHAAGVILEDGKIQHIDPESGNRTDLKDGSKIQIGKIEIVVRAKQKA